MALRSVEYFLDLLSLTQGAKALETPCSPKLPEPVALGLFLANSKNKIYGSQRVGFKKKHFILWSWRESRAAG